MQRKKHTKYINIYKNTHTETKKNRVRKPKKPEILKNPFEKQENQDKPVSSFTKKTLKTKQEAEKETCTHTHTHTLHTKKKQKQRVYLFYTVVVMDKVDVGVTEGLLERNVTAEMNGGNGTHSGEQLDKVRLCDLWV